MKEVLLIKLECGGETKSQTLMEGKYDIVLKIDDRDVRKIGDILTHLERYKHAGDTVQLIILRDGRVENVSVQLGPSSMASRSIESPTLPLQPPNDDSNQEQQSQSDSSNNLLNDLLKIAYKII